MHHTAACQHIYLIALVYILVSHCYSAAPCAGGSLVWIAPSGGRDRPKNDLWSPDAFDPTAVELMRNLINRAKQPGHLYPMTMFSYPIMPPPKTVDKALGERRLTAYSGKAGRQCYF